jgi:hypothetical protein
METNTESTTTILRAVNIWEASLIRTKVDALQRRADRKGLDGSVQLIVGDTYDFVPEFGIVERVADLTLIYSGAFALGEYTPVGVVDFTAADEPLIHTFGDDTIVGELDDQRCDHCGARAHRAKVFVVADTDGNQIHLGSTCVRDFLGHDALSTLIIREGGDRDLDGGVEQTPTKIWIHAAAVATKAFGYRKASEARSTRAVAHDLIVGRSLPRDEQEAVANARTVTDDDVEAIIEWAKAQTGSDFADNMAKIARSDWIGRKAYGIAAFIPEGFYRDQAKQAERDLRDAAEAKRRDAAAPVPTEGRVTIEGTIASIRTRETDFGIVEKVTVVSDEGWKVWGTLPRALAGTYDWDLGEVVGEAHEGDRIRFVARITAADDDPTFGFFARPTKAEIVAPAAV